MLINNPKILDNSDTPFQLKSEARFESRVDLTLFQEESSRKVMSKLNNEKLGMSLVGDTVDLGKLFI
jgi:hypothetical protein